MSLTLEAEQRLTAVHLVELFDNNKASWQAAAKRTYEFIKTSFPPGSVIRRDDVAKALKPILEVDKLLQDRLAANKLKQKFWVSYFADLIIDRVWDGIT